MYINNKKSAYFYFAVAAIIIMLGLMVYDITSYIKMINNYTAQGYSQEFVMSYYPIIKTLFPTFADRISSIGLLAAVLFLANTVSTRLPLKNVSSETKPEVDNVSLSATPEEASPKDENEKPEVSDNTDTFDKDPQQTPDHSDDNINQ